MQTLKNYSRRNLLLLFTTLSLILFMMNGLMGQVQDLIYGVPIELDYGITSGGGGNWTINEYPRKVGDVNGDGRADLVLFTKSAVYVSIGNGNGTFQNPKVAIKGAYTVDPHGWKENTTPRELADVNGDGRVDLVGFGGNYVYVSLGQTNGTFDYARESLESAFGTDQNQASLNLDENSYRLGDVNGDGKADIVAFGDNSIYVSLSKENGYFHTPKAALTGGFTANPHGWKDSETPRMVGDVNGDGRADLVGFDSKLVWVSLGAKDGTFEGALQAFSGDLTLNQGGWQVAKHPRRLADVNGDGRMDIVGFGSSKVLVFYGQSDGTFGKANQALQAYFTDSNGWKTEKDLRLLADFNGDRKADIVGFRPNNFWVTLQGPSFHMIFMADPQFPWMDDDKSYGQDPDYDKAKASLQKNTNLVSSINLLYNEKQNTTASVKGLIINGDLTAFGHGWQLDYYKHIYEGKKETVGMDIAFTTEEKYPVTGDNYEKPKMTIYPGLGNHDVYNNYNDCGENFCFIRMVEYMAEKVAGFDNNIVKNKDLTYNKDTYKFPEILVEITGSLSYSWDIGNVHFVQLQNYPTFKKTADNYVAGRARRFKVNITSPLDTKWLENDLAKARNEGKAIILNYHDEKEHWGDGISNTEEEDYKKEFKELLTKYKVSAVFVGHLHSYLGKADSLEGSDVDIPVIYSGAPSYDSYLSVHFMEDKMKVQPMSSKNGNAEKHPNKTAFTIPLEIDKPTEELSIPKKDGYVTIFNQGGYVARGYLSYIDSTGKKVKKETGRLSLGNSKRYDVPSDATNIKVRVERDIGWVFDPWKDIFNKTYPSVISKCFKVYGTTLDPDWNHKCN